MSTFGYFLCWFFSGFGCGMGLTLLYVAKDYKEARDMMSRALALISEYEILNRPG